MITCPSGEDRAPVLIGRFETKYALTMHFRISVCGLVKKKQRAQANTHALVSTTPIFNTVVQYIFTRFTKMKASSRIQNELKLKKLISIAFHNGALRHHCAELHHEY